MSAEPEAAKGATLLLDQGVARNLVMGEIVEENLFPYPAIRPRDRELLGHGRRRPSTISSTTRTRTSRRWDREGAPARRVRAVAEGAGAVRPDHPGGVRRHSRCRMRPMRVCWRRRQQLRQLGVAHDRRAQLDRHEGPPAVRHAGAEGALPAAARDRRDDRGVLPDRAGRRLRRRVDPHHGEAQRGRQLDAQRREDLDHQRRHRRLLHRLRAHRRARGQDHRVPRRGGVAGRQPRPARGQDGHPRLLARPRWPSTTCACRQKTCSATSARASRSRWAS